MDAMSWCLQSTRLTLRRLRPQDAESLCSYRRLPLVAAFQSWHSFELHDAQELINGQASVVPNDPGTWLQLGIVEPRTMAFIGDCGIHFLTNEPSQVELGITLSPEHQGQGLAREALTLVLEYAFGALGKHRAIAIVDDRNEPAARLFRGLGFRQEAHFLENTWFKGTWGSELGFALLKREWQSLPRNPIEA